MRVYLIRHGKARPGSETGLDADRELAEKGRAQARWMGRALREGDAPPARLLASPAVRTTQTAELIGEALGLEPCGEPVLGLGTSDSAVIELIGQHADACGGAEPLALVGHNPTLSIVTELLCRGLGGRAELDLRTGQAAVLDVRAVDTLVGGATLVGLLRGEAC